MHEPIDSEHQDPEILLWPSLVELSHVASIAEDIEQVYQSLSSTIRRFVQFDRLAIRLIDEGSGTVTNVFVSGAEIPGWQPGEIHEMDTPITAKMLATREPIVVSTAATGPTASELLELGHSLQEFPSLLAVPLISRGKMHGAIYLRSRSCEGFTHRHVQIVESFATHIAPTLENARHVEGLAAEAEERKVMLEMGRTITSSLDIDSVYERFAELVSQMIPADRITVTTINPDGKTLLSRFSSGLRISSRKPGISVDLRGTISQAAIDSGSPITVHIRNIADTNWVLENYPALQPVVGAGLKSLMVAPMVSEGRVVGTFHVQSKRFLAYSSKHEEMIQQVAAFAASAIAKSDLMSRIERESTERQILAEMGRIIGSTLDFGDVFERVADEVRKLLPADRLVITTIDDKAITITDRYISGLAIPRWDTQRNRQLQGLPTEAVVKEREATITHSEQELDSGLRTDGLVESRGVGLNSAMFAPLISADRVIGTMNVKSSIPNAYSISDREVLKAIALQISGAVAASDLYLKTLRLADEREKRLQAESEIRELHRVNQAKSEFLSTVSHELKTPLTSILAFTGMLSHNRSEELSETDIKQLEVIKRNGEQLDRLISDLVDVSRLQANTISLSPTRFDLNETLQHLEESLKPIVAAKSQVIYVTSPDGEITLFADKDRVTQVIANLTNNASKYSPNGTDIIVNVELDRDSVSVSVRDHGIGISETDQLELFTPFFRADNEATRAQQGTGLGLVIVKAITDMHSGSLSVKSKPGAGSTFTATIPLEFQNSE